VPPIKGRLKHTAKELEGYFSFINISKRKQEIKEQDQPNGIHKMPVDREHFKLDFLVRVCNHDQGFDRIFGYYGHFYK
jgi:hypothetical protein